MLADIEPEEHPETESSRPRRHQENVTVDQLADEHLSEQVRTAVSEASEFWMLIASRDDAVSIRLSGTFKLKRAWKKWHILGAALVVLVFWIAGLIAAVGDLRVLIELFT